MNIKQEKIIKNIYIMNQLPSTPFWLNEPTILFNKKQIADIWPN